MWINFSQCVHVRFIYSWGCVCVCVSGHVRSFCGCLHYGCWSPRCVGIWKGCTVTISECDGKLTLRVCVCVCSCVSNITKSTILPGRLFSFLSSSFLLSIEPCFSAVLLPCYKSPTEHHNSSIHTYIHTHGNTHSFGPESRSDIQLRRCALFILSDFHWVPFILSSLYRKIYHCVTDLLCNDHAGLYF